MAEDIAEVEIRALEERLLRFHVRNSREELERLIADDFVEFGSSGRIFDKPAIIRSLVGESVAFRYTLEDFRVTLLAPNVALVAYRLVCHVRPGEPRQTLRSSIWIDRAGAWQILFHQGTPTTAAAVT